MSYIEAKIHDKNVKSMLTSMQMLHSETLQEGGSHDDCIDDVLPALIAADDDEFELEIILSAQMFCNLKFCLRLKHLCL